jgi:vacuolar-type H+-ATPase subunit H
MDSVERIEAAILAVEEARSVPLSASCVVHRGESFPNDLNKAIQIVKDKERILDEARNSADKIIENAREEVADQVSQTAIVAAARKEAQKILSDANSESKKERDEIDSYIDSRLASLEVVLNKTLDVISRGRDQLGGIDTKHALKDLKD